MTENRWKKKRKDEEHFSVFNHRSERKKKKLCTVSSFMAPEVLQEGTKTLQIHLNFKHTRITNNLSFVIN